MSILLHLKHVCLAHSAEDSPSKAKVQHVDAPLNDAEKTDNKDEKPAEPMQGKRKNYFFYCFFFLTFTSA